MEELHSSWWPWMLELGFASSPGTLPLGALICGCWGLAPSLHTSWRLICSQWSKQGPGAI